MAIILIIEDRVADRKLLTAILRTHGHEVVEATDGQEALERLAQIRPAVVISDILMPTVDGYEFVRRMRQIPAVAATPVIFYTATYHEREARALAHQCGVVDVLMKPSPPRVILATIDAALGSRPQTLPPNTGYLVPDVEVHRMEAVLETAERIIAERDPATLFDTVCAAARQITLAQHAVVGFVTEEGSRSEIVCTSGFDTETTAHLTPPRIDSALLASVLHQRRPLRSRTLGGAPESLGLPADHPRVTSLLSVPIASVGRVYGWLSLRNKLGADEFSEIDERVATALGVHAGVAYEITRAFEEQLRHRSARVRQDERARLSRSLHDHVGQALVGLKMDADRLADELKSTLDPARSDVNGKVASILEGLSEAIASVRGLTTDLHPPAVDHDGLIAALEAQARDFERRSGIRCHVHMPNAPIPVDPDRATALLMIVREALANVRQHAQATHARLTLRRTPDLLTVSVEDNGRGISTRDPSNIRSLGLTTMRERAALAGGVLDIAQRQPHGTVVTCTMPLPERITGAEP